MTRKNACIICGYMITNIFLLMVAYLGRNNFDLVTWISIIQLALSLFAMTRQRHEVLTVGVVFVALTYLFHFGQSLITTLGFNDVYAHRNVLANTSYMSYVNAELFTMGCFFFLTTGFLFSYRKVIVSNNNVPSIEQVAWERMLRIRKIATYVLIVGIFPLIYLDMIKIKAMVAGSYLDTYGTYTTGVAKYLGLIAQFARPAVTVLLFTYLNDNKKAKTILIISSGYYIVMMLSGDRGTNLINILTNFFVYFKFVKKLKLKYVLVGLVLGYLAMGFISSISLFRYGEFTLQSFLDSFSMRSGDGIIYSILREFGGSIQSLVYAIDFIPKQSPHNYGLTYFAGLLTISPKLPNSLVSALSTCFTYTKAFPIEYQGSLGGSYLGELFYNFGWFGMFFATFIGVFIGKIDQVLSRRNNLIYIATILVLLPSLFLWVRDFYVNMIFKTVWFAILLYVL